VDEKRPEHLIIPENARSEAYMITARLMDKLNLNLGKDAASKSGEFNVRHSAINSMHTLLFYVNERSVSGITFWLDKDGKGVNSVSILTSHNAGAMQKLPEPAINYLGNIRRIAGKRRDAVFMKGPATNIRKNSPRARLR